MKYLPELDNPSHSFNIVASPLIPVECGLFMRKSNINRPTSTVQHLHCFHVLWYCISGNGGLIIDQIPYHLAPGEAVLQLPGQTHARTVIENEPAEYAVIRFKIKTDSPETGLPYNRPLKLSEPEKDFLDKYCTSFISCRNNPDNRIKNDEAVLFLSLLLNSLRSRGFTMPAIPGNIPQKMKKLCHVLISVRENPDPLKKLAEKNGISPGHLRLLCKKNIGKTPSQIRSNMRVWTAESLLANSDLNISEIAQKLGFKSIYAFSRFFKKHRNISPLNFRQQLKKQVADHHTTE